MYHYLGSLLAEWAYEGSTDENSRTLWATVHTTICVASTVAMVKTTKWSLDRTLAHLGRQSIKVAR